MCVREREYGIVFPSFFCGVCSRLHGGHFFSSVITVFVPNVAFLLQLRVYEQPVYRASVAVCTLFHLCAMALYGIVAVETEVYVFVVVLFFGGSENNLDVIALCFFLNVFSCFFFNFCALFCFLSLFLAGFFFRLRALPHEPLLCMPLYFIYFSNPSSFFLFFLCAAT